MYQNGFNLDELQVLFTNRIQGIKQLPIIIEKSIEAGTRKNVLAYIKTKIKSNDLKFNIKDVRNYTDENVKKRVVQ